MVTSKEYSIACVEVIEVLKGLNETEYSKIPKERIELYEKNKDKTYKFELDKTRNFNEQISKVAQAIIANLYVKYIADTKDKKEIYEREKQEFIKQETERRKNLKLNPIFKEDKPINNDSNNNNRYSNNSKNNENALIIKKEGLLKRFFNKIRSFFNKGEI